MRIPPIDQATYQRLQGKELQGWMMDVCRPTPEGIFYRPLVAEGLPKAPFILVMGQNPKTVIKHGARPEFGGVERYTELLPQRGGFEEILEEIAGEVSETRQRLKIVREELERAPNGCPVVEANICAFPTSGEDYERPENAEWVQRGKEISRELLCLLSPSVILAHGNDAFDGLEDLFWLRREQLRLPKSPLTVGWEDPVLVTAPWGGVRIFRYPHLKARGLSKKRIREDMIQKAPSIWRCFSK